MRTHSLEPRSNCAPRHSGVSSLSRLIAVGIASALLGGCTPKPVPVPKSPAAAPPEITPDDASPPSFVSSEKEVEISDDELQQAVKHQLLFDDAVPSFRISVTANLGVVTLEGTVDSMLAAERAVKIAERIKGTRAVVSRIKVQLAARPDAEIARDVRDAMRYDPAADAYEIDVAVADGGVTLTGTVDSYAEKRIAEHVAAGVRGVRDVDNEISVSYREERTDDQILQDIRRQLSIDALVDDLQILPAVNNGHVTLSGKVGSVAERRRAILDSWVTGVRSVSADDLTVEWWERDRFRREPEVAVRSDTEITRAVGDAFLFDPRVQSYEIGVQVDEGTAVLTGNVDDFAAKRAAEKDAEHTVGVLRVRNFIEVTPKPKITDETLTQRVRRALAWDPWVSDEEIAVSVLHGRVSLYGLVDTGLEKRRAEEVVSRLNGVVSVENGLDVEQRESSDMSLREDIENDLIWSPFVVSTNVNVEVDKGTVTLTGKVANWRAYREAAKIAYTAGAQRVINSLEVSELGTRPGDDG